MDAIPIRWFLIVLYYGCIVLWGSAGTPHGLTLIDDASLAEALGKYCAAGIFLLLPFMERSVLYFSSRMLLAASLLRLTAGSYFYLLCSLSNETLKQFIFEPVATDPKPAEFFWLWGSLLSAIFSSAFLRYLKHKQKRFVRLPD